MLIYNLFPLLVGPFTEWGPHLERAAGMGFTWIFVNPVQFPGFSGSLYSIKNYFALNPALVNPTSPLGQDEQLKAAIAETNGLGMQMMVDLVVNHCAVDSDIVKEHPEWFAWKKGKVVNPFAWDNGKKVVWGDLARFDHAGTKDKDGLYEFFRSVTEHFITLGFRGFRCDAAYQVPRPFWKRLIADVRTTHPDVIFAAETLGCTPEQTRKTATAGFDYIFNSAKWWDMKSPWLMEQYELTRETSPSISFPETHDTLRLAYEDGGNIAHLKQRYLFSALFSSGVMMPIGFEFGFRKKLHVVKTRSEDWEQTGIDLTNYISDVNAIKNNNLLFQEECPTAVIESDNPNILIMWKGSAHNGQEALVIINKDVDRPQSFTSANLYSMILCEGPLIDVSPENRMDFIPTPFEYHLAPGQGLVMVTEA
jgi:starch synthase (maltosyl-transferring)